MKKLYILGLIILSFCFSGYSQCPIGASVSEIKKLYPDFNLINSKPEDEFKNVYHEDPFFIKGFFLDDKNICNVCILIPYDTIFLSELIELYNNNFVIISDTKWKSYTKTGIINIELQQTDDGTFYFSYY